MKRVGSIIGVRPEKLEEYKRLHANVWPGVLEMIKACNIRNYSIYYKDGMLYSYYEYVGDDYEADMKKMAADPTTQEWWKLCNPCQDPVASRKEGDGGPKWKKSFIWIKETSSCFPLPIKKVNGRKRCVCLCVFRAESDRNDMSFW